MPFVFGIVGIVLIVAGVRGTVSGTNPNLISLLKDDFTGSPNYLEWMAAIFMIGAIGYIPELQKLSRAFMTLVIIGLIWSNRGFLPKLSQELQSNDTNIQPTEYPSAQSNVPSQLTQNLQQQYQSTLNNQEDFETEFSGVI
jgi:hypothetical protein